MHTREHVHYNQLLKARGYPAESLERSAMRLVRFVRLITRPRQRLASSCALEHFTATTALYALRHRMFDDADPRMRSFWNWHAGEELEHKSVAFDVYMASGGSYLERVYFMFMTTLVVRSYETLHLLRLMWSTGLLFSRRLVHEARTEKPPKGMFSQLLLDYLAYYRPGFHPSQLDGRREVDDFRAELATAPLYAEAEAEAAR